MKKRVQAIREVMGSLQLDNLYVSKSVLTKAVYQGIKTEMRLSRERVGKNGRTR